MTTYTTSVNAPDVETLINMVQDMVIDHHEVASFEQMRSPAKKSITEWYNDTVTKIMECQSVFGYKLYSGDEESPSETLLTVTAVGRIRIQSSIQ